MKQSELTMTGDTYRLTPNAWGDPYVMVDEEQASAAMEQSFGESADPDDDPNDRPETVHIATDSEGNFYAILEPYEGTSWGRKTGIIYNEGLFRPIDNPADAEDGLTAFKTSSWDSFDD